MYILNKCKKWIAWVGLVLCSLIAQTSFAEVPLSFTYQGRLFFNDGITPLQANVDFNIGLYDPTATCLLYEESHKNIALTNGLFSLNVGSPIGNSKRTSNDPGLSMASVFSNQSSSIRNASSANCVLGYTPSSQDSRKIKVTILNRTNGELTVMSPLQEILMTPYAIVSNSSLDANKLGGKAASEFIQIEGVSVTQAKVKSLTDNSVSILNLLNGSIQVNDIPVSSANAVNKNYVDNKVNSITPLATCTSGSFNRWNGSAWICEADQNSGGAGSIPDATSVTKGLVQIGSGLAINSGVVSASIDNANVSGTIAISKISGKGSASLYNVPVTGNAGTAELVKGDDSRLIDSRTPIDGSVTSSKISDGAVTDAKISSVAASKVTGTLSGNIKLTDAATCDDTTKGTIKYVAGDNKFYGCKGTTLGWVDLGGASGGGGGGAGVLNVVPVSSNYTSDSDDDLILVDASTGDVQISLPTAVGNSGKQISIKKVDSTSNVVTISSTLGQYIDGGLCTLTTVKRNAAITLVADGTQWQGVGSYFGFNSEGPSGSQTFVFTGANQTFLVPSCKSTITVKAWGAGGGGVGSTSSGGAGAAVVATLEVTPGEPLTVIVGGGGGRGSTTLYGAATFGGGGAGGASAGTYPGGGAGGGRSALRRSSTEILTAAGGAGAARDCNGPAGGVTSGGVGGNGGSTSGGGAGTQASGGAAGNGSPASTAGSQFQGGSAGGVPGTTSTVGGGGGGSGYYGGGGGGSYTGGAGGGSCGGSGSSLVPSGGSGYAGSGTTAGNNTDPAYVNGIGKGGAPADTTGGNGLIHISW